MLALMWIVYRAVIAANQAFICVMKQEKILHICSLDKFIPPFIDFVEINFDFERHFFVLIGDIEKFPVQIGSNITHLNLSSKVQFTALLMQMHLARKIILHGIFHREIVRLLSHTPWLLAKCYWVMWGGDLYHYQFRARNIHEDKYEKTRAYVIRRIGHFVTYVKGDYELVQQWYCATGKYHECFMYPSNLYKEHAAPLKIGTQINILAGNSADPSNRHQEIFEKLAVYKNENVMIYCPLSYGDRDNAMQVAKKGAELFGSKFVALMEFMPFEKYLELLGQIDIAFFAHKRQQAVGSTITLLGLGKTVYMRKDVTPWAMFDKLGIKVFDVHKLDLVQLDEDARKKNQVRIKNHFSELELTKQLRDIFES